MGSVSEASRGTKGIAMVEVVRRDMERERISVGGYILYLRVSDLPWYLCS